MSASEFLSNISPEWRGAWERLIHAYGLTKVIRAKEAADVWSRNCPAQFRTMEYESRERAKAFDKIIGGGFSYATFDKDWGAK